MTKYATLSRNGTTIDVPLLESGSGNPLVARDIGKPHLQVRGTGAADPFFNDDYSGLVNYAIVGRFFGSNAYDNAIDLADMIKNHGEGSPITLNLPGTRYDNDISVVPAGEQDQGVNLVYNPGHKDWVTVDLTLTRVSAYFGADSVNSDLQSTTPTATGTGPISLSDGSQSVSFENDITVERSTGRPNSTLSRRTNESYPAYQDKQKMAHDEIELSVTFKDNNVTKINKLNDIVSSRLRRTPLTLDFGGLYNIGSMKVAPTGSRAIRDTNPSAHESVSIVPTLTLRRVRQI